MPKDNFWTIMVKHNGRDVTQELTFFMDNYGSDITDLNCTPADIRPLEYAKSNTQMNQYSILLKHFWSFFNWQCRRHESTCGLL